MILESVVMVGTETVKVALAPAAPLLLVVLTTDLIISTSQVTAQVNEVTLSSIPKVTAVFIATITAGPWVLNLLPDYVSTLFVSLSYIIG